jgi:hypothetical protein
MMAPRVGAIWAGKGKYLESVADGITTVPWDYFLCMPIMQSPVPGWNLSLVARVLAACEKP